MIKGLQLQGVGIEIGVQRGLFSKVILENSKLYLYLLDSWRKFDIGYVDTANVENKVQMERMVMTVNNLLSFEGRFTLIRDTSENGSKLFQNNFFDFIYIDANHSYDASLLDLNLWYPKLKSGGILAGHDYINDLPTFEVKRAVDEFSEKHSLKIENVTVEKFPSYYIKKP